MEAIKKLTIKLLLFSLILAGIIYLLQEFIKPEWVHATMWIILSFFVLLTWLTGMFSHYLLELSKENSVNILLGAMASAFWQALFCCGTSFLGTENLICLWSISDLFLLIV